VGVGDEVALFVDAERRAESVALAADDQASSLLAGLDLFARRWLVGSEGEPGQKHHRQRPHTRERINRLDMEGPPESGRVAEDRPRRNCTILQTDRTLIARIRWP